MKKPESAGSRLKREILELFVLNPAELLLLDEGAALADALARIDAELADAPLLTQGSAGQPVENPLLRSQREHAARLASTLEAIGLPRPNEEEGRSATSKMAQRAAQVRWAREKRGA
jgi:hypothetical protein